MARRMVEHVKDLSEESKTALGKKRAEARQRKKIERNFRAKKFGIALGISYANARRKEPQEKQP